MSTLNEAFGVILSMAVAVAGFLLVVGANNYVWPQGDCEGTYYLDPTKPFSSPVMEINSSNYASQCGKYVTAPDPNSKVGETLLGETIYGGSDLSNFGPCREYEKCKAALEVRTFDSIGDFFRLSLLLMVIFGIVIGTLFAGLRVVDAVGNISDRAAGFFSISYLGMVAASTTYLAKYYWSIGKADHYGDAYGYPVAIVISIAGFGIFLFFLFVLKDELREFFDFGGGATEGLKSADTHVEEKFQVQTVEERELARKLQQRFYELVLDYSQPAAKEATIHDDKWIDNLMKIDRHALLDHPTFRELIEAVADEFSEGDADVNRRIAESLRKDPNPYVHELFCSTLEVCRPHLVRDPKFALRRPMMFWQRLKIPAKNREDFSKLLHQLGVLAFERGSKDTVLDNVSSYIPGDCLILYGTGRTIWGVAEIAGDSVKHIDEYDSLEPWELHFKWVREVRWLIAETETADAKKSFESLKEQGIAPPRAFCRGMTAAQAKKARKLMRISGTTEERENV